MTTWIAEIGSNHNRSLERTIDLIDKAAEIGCNGVKFQLFKARLLYTPEFRDRIASMEKWELPESFLATIKSACRWNGLEFGCSVFDLQSVEIAKGFVDWLKIGSYEMLWFPLLKAVIETKIPWSFSTGMTTNMNEVLLPVAMGIRKRNPPYAVLHCNSNYPALPEHCNLSQIKRIKRFIGIAEATGHKNLHKPIKVGWSDHTRNPELVLAAIGQGASVVEFHFDLEDGKGNESKFRHCWKPSEAKALIEKSKTLSDDSYPDGWIHSNTREEEVSKWRTDPEDGLRPLKRYRKELLNEAS